MAAKKVLIVEDDTLLANTLASAVKKVGYESVVCSRPEQAQAALDHDSFKVVFIDCLLPQTPGIDFAKSIRKNFDASILPIVLMSGIFTDKQMMKEMAQEVSAIDFLKKPFEVNDVLKFLEKDQSLAKSIFSLPDRVGAHPTQMSKTLRQIDRIHGYELPLLFAAVVTNGYSGIVQLTAEKGEQTRITLNRGVIYSVESPDVQSALGKLLAMHGWVLQDDLDLVLSQPSDKKIGQRLVEENFISPHAVYEVMDEQMAVRLAKLLQDQFYSVHFDDQVVELNDPSIDPEEFYFLLEEWIREKIPAEWLNQQMIHWQEYVVHLGPSHEKGRRDYEVLLLAPVRGIFSSLEKGGLLATMQQEYQRTLTEFNRAVFYLLCLRVVLFGEKIAQMSEPERIARLQKLWSQIKDLSLVDTFYLMGGKKGASPEEARKVYIDFTRRHLGVAPRLGGDPAFQSVYEAVKKRVDHATEIFSDTQKLVSYERELEAGKVSKRGEAHAKLEEIKKLLAVRQYSSALVLINNTAQVFPDLEQLPLYQVWARTGLLAKSRNKQKDLTELESLIAKTSSEQKLSAIGNFVQGLVAKEKGEVGAAKKYFEAALVAEKNFIEARRELNTLPAEAKKPVDIFHADLGQVIGSLFKKS